MFVSRFVYFCVTIPLFQFLKISILFETFLVFYIYVLNQIAACLLFFSENNLIIYQIPILHERGKLYCFSVSRGFRVVNTLTNHCIVASRFTIICTFVNYKLIFALFVQSISVCVDPVLFYLV